jgi:hypothetical protein
LPLTKIALALIDRRSLDLAEIEEIIAANATGRRWRRRWQADARRVYGGPQ